jgi:hypothetical protein
MTSTTNAATTTTAAAAETLGADDGVASLVR